MYSVLIAEDEMLVRMGLTVSVPWEKFDMCVVAELSDGQAAWAAFLANKPQIVITDLSMPGLDGLQLIRKIRESKTPCAIIVITCMDRFEPLHEAMELGVTAYLVKATMNIAQMEEALKKARAFLGPSNKDAGEAGSQKAREAMLNDYLFENRVGFRELSAAARLKGMALRSGYFVLCAKTCGERAISWQLQKILKSMLAERMQSQHVVQVLQKNNMTLLFYTRTPKVHEIADRCRALYLYIMENFNVKITFVAGMGEVATQELPQFIKCFSSLCETSAHDAFRLLWLDDRGVPADAQVSAEFDFMREAFWRVSDYSFAKRAAAQVDELEIAFEHCGERFIPLANELMRSLYEQAGLSREQEDGLGIRWNEENSVPDILQGINRFAAERLPSYRTEICTVISYILRNLKEALSLKQSAALISMHPQYLSNLFKKDVGVSYSDFICNVRLQAAKRRLRDSGESVQRVAEECGFSDMAYFCRRFKRLTGSTPNAWRRIERCE